MNNFIPKDINFDLLSGPDRKNLNFLEDKIAWSLKQNFFVIAYSVTEISMCNEVGCITYGYYKDNKSLIIEAFNKIKVCCWYSNWCKWISETCFVFKAYYFNGKKLFIPVIAIDVYEGFFVFPKTDKVSVWIDNVNYNDIKFSCLTENSIIDDIVQNGSC